MLSKRGSRTTLIISIICAAFTIRLIGVDVVIYDFLHATDDKTRQTEPSSKPRGVFVLKVETTETLLKTLCTLNVFFNEKAQYPVRIFTDRLSPHDAEVLKFSGNSDVKIILISRWQDLPPMLSPSQREAVVSQCQDFDDKVKALCSSLKVSLGYLFNIYWTYMEMANEPELQQFDYFVYLDNDAYLTAPMPDPFLIMQQNGLVGIYSIESMEGGLIDGIQQATEASFTLEERKNRFLDSPNFPLTDENGIWGGSTRFPSGVWAHFFGGQLDILRSKRYREFAEQIAFHTYMYRTSEQTVIPLGWSFLAGGDKVWYLPKRGIKMGVYHHGWVDDAEIIRADGNARPVNYTEHTLLSWNNFSESNIHSLLLWREYMEFQPESRVGTNWRKCIDVRGSAKYG